VGRFAATDPSGGGPYDPISLHRYLYASNNPVNVMDPSGLEGEGGLLGTLGTLAVAGVVNAMTTFVFDIFKGQSTTPSELWGSFAVGAVTAPVGGLLVKAFAPLIRATLEPLLVTLGEMAPVVLTGSKTAFEKFLIRVSRIFVNTNQRYPSVVSTPVGRVLKMAFPKVEWEMHHVFIQQCWSRVGSSSQLYGDLVANEGLRRIGNGLWNLLPIPAAINSWLGRPPVGPVATQMLATFYYSVIVFGSAHIAAALAQ
jgi:hypothetical protein